MLQHVVRTHDRHARRWMVRSAEEDRHGQGKLTGAVSRDGALRIRTCRRGKDVGNSFWLCCMLSWRIRGDQGYVQE